MLEQQEWLDRELKQLGERASTKSEWNEYSYSIQGPDDARTYADLIRRRRLEYREIFSDSTRPRVRPASTSSAPGWQPIHDPQSWEGQRQRLFEPLRVRTRMVRGVLGLTDLLQPKGVAPFLRELRKHERQEGDPFPLSVPVVKRDAIDIETWGVFGRPQRVDGVSRDLGQPLGFLAEQSARMSAEIDLEQALIVLYLLSGQLPYWPSVTVEVHRRPRFAIVIRAESPFLDPKAIAALYTLARGSVYARSSASAEQKLTLGTRIWSRELVQFVGERRRLEWPKGAHRPPDSWSEIFAEWSRTYPDKPFKGGYQALRRTYEEASRRVRDLDFAARPGFAPAPWRPQPAVRWVLDSDDDGGEPR